MRVLSLVPSATETLLALGVEPVAGTRFCEQPGIPAVGGTKNPDVERIVELAPDLVVMNDEENRHDDYLALTGAGLRVHSMSPRSLDEVGPAVDALARVVEAATPAPFTAGAWTRELGDIQATAARPSRRCATLIWRRPWMLLGVDTYGSSLLDALGHGNAVEPGERYPETTLEGIARLEPDVVLLPSEPYVFGPRHRSEVAGVLPAAEVRLVDGRDLFWWGIRTPAAARRVRASLG